ncbi:MAG: serine/threonine-protein kinase [Candidatus Solibacter sp.]
MQPSVQPVSPTTETLDSDSPRPGGAFLRRGGSQSADRGTQTRARIAGGIADEASRRIGTLAILTTVTVVGASVLHHALSPELAAAQQTPLFRLSALFLVLAGAGLAALQRSGLLTSQDLLDVGLVFEVAGALALSLMENANPVPATIAREYSGVSAWITICVMVIPNRPWKSIAAAIASAAMVPCGHLLAAQILGYPAMRWNALAAYSLAGAIVAGWTPFISTRLHRMREDLRHARDFGSYHLEKLIGRGGMGEVWLAHHILLRRDAAVKLVLPRLLEGLNASARRLAQRRFEQEAQAIASLRSPHTVAIYDFGVAEGGSLYYAMEYLQGVNAEELIDRYGPQPAGRVIAFLRQAIDSLEEAHESGLIHRDVKPSNVFITRIGKRTDFVKLLDFGLVKALADPNGATEASRSQATGTPAFMAPEQVRGDEVDPRTDIYGLGCVAYFLLTGMVIFNKSGAMAMAMAHVTELPELPSTRSELPIPASLERLVMGCLAKDPNDRPQSAAELRARLDACTDVAPWSQADADRWWALHRPEAAAKALP